jgi:cell division septation protein DedD
MRVFALNMLLTVALSGPALAREPIQPAELPAADYAGQQYVDSKGCMFVRAGTAAKVLWVPRVSRDGVPLCGNPPSGKRVPVAEEVGVQPVPDAGGTVAQAVDPGPAQAAPDDAVPTQGIFFVAVGSFGVAANADRAEARLTALKYRVVRGKVQGATKTLTTIFAGPYADSATAAGVRDSLVRNGFPDATVIGP